MLRLVRTRGEATLKNICKASRQKAEKKHLDAKRLVKTSKAKVEKSRSPSKRVWTWDLGNGLPSRAEEHVCSKGCGMLTERLRRFPSSDAVECTLEAFAILTVFAELMEPFCAALAGAIA
jgi:hypothetical protein